MRPATSNPRVSPTTSPPMPTRCAPSSSACRSVGTAASTASCSSAVESTGGSIYVRAWRFLQRRLHLRPRANSCPADLETRAKHSKSGEHEQWPTDGGAEANTIGGSLCMQWQRIHLLKELEAAGARAQWRRHHQAQSECIQETAEWISTDVPSTGARVQPVFRTQAQRKAAQVTCGNCGRLFFRALAVALDTSAFCSRDCQSTFEYLHELQGAVDDREDFRSPVAWTHSSKL